MLTYPIPIYTKQYMNRLINVNLNNGKLPTRFNLPLGCQECQKPHWLAPMKPFSLGHPIPIGVLQIVVTLQAKEA